MPPCRAARAAAQAPRVTRDLFDRKLRALRRDRAACDRAGAIPAGPRLRRMPGSARRHRFAGSIGRCCSAARPRSWPERLERVRRRGRCRRSGPVLRQREQDGIAVEEDRHDFGEAQYDLCIAVGTLDTVNDLPLALHMIRRALQPDGLLIGAIAGGNSLPALRAALIEGDRLRVEPSPEPIPASSRRRWRGCSPPPALPCRWSTWIGSACAIPALATWSAIFGPWARPACWPSAAAACRNPRPAGAAEAFAQAGSGGRTEENVEILHFLGWSQ